MKNDIFGPAGSEKYTPPETVNVPDIKALVTKKKKPIPTQRIAEVGVMTAAVVVVFLITGAIVDSLLPFIGCLIRTIAVAIFISGFRHYSGFEFLMINFFGSVIYFLLYPCTYTLLSMPISMSFVLVYNVLRRRVQPWLSISIGVVVAYMVMIAMLPLVSMNNVGDYSKFIEYFNTILKWSWFLLLLVPVAWWRQKRNKVLSCTGCNMDCNTVSLNQ